MRPEGQQSGLSGGPSLYASITGERHATWLELFFDLVFVLAIAELARFLHDKPTLDGFLSFAFLFVPVWWLWLSFTYYADLFDADGPVYRVVMLAAMLLVVAFSMNIHGALDGSSSGFALTFAAMQALLVGLYLWAWRSEPAARPLSARYSLGFSLGALLWLFSLLAPETVRYWFWGLALLVEILTPVLGQLTVLKDVPVQVSHMPERLRLFTLIVLGESVVVTGSGVADTSWQPSSVLVAGLGFVAVACLWWLYFDHIDDSAVDRGFSGGLRELLISFVWSYGHLAIFAGLTATAVGIGLAITEAGEAALGSGARAALCGGTFLYLLAISAIHPLSPSPLPKVALAARLLVAAFALALVSSGLPPPVLVGALTLALTGLTFLEVAGFGPPFGGGSAR